MLYISFGIKYKVRYHLSDYRERKKYNVINNWNNFTSKEDKKKQDTFKERISIRSIQFLNEFYQKLFVSNEKY